MNRRGVKKILLMAVGIVAFAYEFATFVPDRVIYIKGGANELPEFVSGIPKDDPSPTEELTIFGIIPYKTVAVDVVEDERVILGGESIGVNIEIDGVMILGFSEFYGEDGKKHCPAKEAGLKAEDVITEINGEKVVSAEHFSQIVDNCSQDTAEIKFSRNGQTKTARLTPVKSAEDGEYHLGLWARDGTSGIGTLTFINPKDETFGALGHSVNDAETGDVIKLGSGNIYYSAITEVKPASKGIAGELKGNFISHEIGDVKKNTEFGIYGRYDGTVDYSKSVDAAARGEIKEGAATMLCCIDGDNVESFGISVEKINANSDDNKSMVIKVTDPVLVQKTGGIVQGMSGSPIVQNGKLIGAVTHVFVNDPTRGYAVFIENMLAEAEKAE